MFNDGLTHAPNFLSGRDLGVLKGQRLADGVPTNSTVLSMSKHSLVSRR
jgi:hypothetical protein